MFTCSKPAPFDQVKLPTIPFVQVVPERIPVVQLCLGLHVTEDLPADRPALGLRWDVYDLLVRAGRQRKLVGFRADHFNLVERGGLNSRLGHREWREHRGAEQQPSNMPQ